MGLPLLSVSGTAESAGRVSPGLSFWLSTWFLPALREWRRVTLPSLQCFAASFLRALLEEV